MIDSQMVWDYQEKFRTSRDAFATTGNVLNAKKTKVQSNGMKE